MNTGAPMEVLKRLFFLFIFLCTAIIIVSTAEARPQKMRAGGPKELINIDPCIAILTVDYDNEPDQLVCVGSGKLGGVLASISIPVPMIADKQPELSLVGIPTYFSMTWDASSFGYTDSDSTTYEWVGDDNRRNRLTGVRIQMRIVPYRVNEELGNVQVLSVNPNLFVKVEGGIEGRAFTDEVCNPGWKGGLNSLLMIPEQWGGWQSAKPYPYEKDATVCNSIKSALDEGNNHHALGDNYVAGRYLNWKINSLVGYPRIFGAISESASISGEGTVNGSPAYQIEVKTFVQIEKRVIWDKHEIYREYEKGASCKWEYYYTGFDFVDINQWPEPIYCKHIYGMKWYIECEGHGCDISNALGDPDTWWEKFCIPTQCGYYAGDTVVFNDGFDYRYSDAVEVVVIQAQPLLIVP